MKKIFIVFCIMALTMPVFAVCSITGGACSAPVNFESSNIREKLVPDNLKKIQRTDAFQPKINKPAGSGINLPNNNNLKQNPESGGFDNDCIFGGCLEENKTIVNP